MSPIDSRPQGEPALVHVLVLLACRNGKHWIEPQVQSILQQRDVRLSMVISDDASSDGTDDIVEAICQSDSRVTMLARQGASGSAGANFRRLFRQVTLEGVDFVALADQDDLWLPDKLAHAVRSLRDARADSYSSSVVAFWDDGRERILAQSSRQRAADFLFEGAGQGCTFVLTGDFFRDVQDFCTRHRAEADAMHYHDWLIYLLARSTGRRWLFDAESRIRYRQHESNEIGARGGLNAARRRIDKIRDGWFRSQVSAAIAASAAAGQTGGAPAAFRRLLAPRAGRFALAIALLRHSRRRAGDRAVLVVAALLGWL